MRNSIGLFAVLMLCCSQADAQAKPRAVGAKPANSEWVLEQMSEMGGTNTVYIYHDGAKVVNSRHGSHILVKAPLWKVHCFQPKEKVEWVGNMQLFSGIVMTNPYVMARDPHVKTLKPIGAGTLNGLKYTKFIEPVARGDYIYVADDIPVAPQVAEFLARVYSLGYTPKVPLYHCKRRTGSSQASNRSEWMDTALANDLRSGMIVGLNTHSWKKIPYRQKDFELPIGYKQTADIIAVTFSPEKKLQINDIVDSIGFTSAAGKNEPKETSKKH